MLRLFWHNLLCNMWPALLNPSATDMYSMERFRVVCISQSRENAQKTYCFDYVDILNSSVYVVHIIIIFEQIWTFLNHLWLGDKIWKYSGLPSYLSSQLSHYHPARELRLSSSNLLVQQILILPSLLYNHLHPRFGTNCLLKSNPHTHSRLLRAGLKLTTSANHVPRSRASPHLSFVPHCLSELAVPNPGVFKFSLLLLNSF